jgi:hypothetical protein
MFPLLCQSLLIHDRRIASVMRLLLLDSNDYTVRLEYATTKASPEPSLVS